VDGDAGIFGIRDWWMVAGDCDEWKEFLEVAKTALDEDARMFRVRNWWMGKGDRDE
jgi:hypothetical protein